MEHVSYKETPSDLQTRIDIHEKFGTKDIDKWMLTLLNPRAGMKILDVGCGLGKQCFLFYDYLEGKCLIVGGDVSGELLERAEKENKARNSNIQFVRLDFNEPFPFTHESFDLITCCFALYYARNVVFTIDEMFRILKPDGRLFVSGPMPNNKKIFYDIIRESTGNEVPPMPGNLRFSSEILGTLKKFGKVEVHVFENPVIFTGARPFLEYTSASLSEDRKLWARIFVSWSFDQALEKISKVAEDLIEKNGSIVMTKVVGGFITQKNGSNRLQ